MKVTVGLVGNGFAAAFHVENYRRIPGLSIHIKGVASRDASKAAQFARDHSLDKAYGSVDEMLADPDIDLVDLCVPTFQHAPLTIQTAAAGKNVVCEKPLTGCFEERDKVSGREMFDRAIASADEMAAAIDKAGVKFCYAENWVYAPSIRKADSTLSQTENAIMRIVAEESHSGSHSPYAKQWKTSGGGALYNKGCHPLSGVLCLKANEGMRKTGKPIVPVSVSAQVANLTHMENFQREEQKWIGTGWIDCEDWGTMVVTFSDGSVAQVTAADTVIGGILNVSDRLWQQGGGPVQPEPQHGHDDLRPR